MFLYIRLLMMVNTLMNWELLTKCLQVSFEIINNICVLMTTYHKYSFGT